MTFTPYNLRAFRQPAEQTLLGLDLGQRRDYTALAVIQRTIEPRPLPENPKVTHPTACYGVVGLDRIQNQSYESIAEAVLKLKRREGLFNAKLIVDETGVGQAVCDMLDVRGLRPERITITGGDTVTRSGRSYRVPKRDLAGVVAVLLESRRLKIAPGLALANVLTEELANFKVKITTTGHDTYGAGDDWREGNHDDLVLAVALALWFSEGRTKGRAWGFDPIRGIN